MLLSLFTSTLMCFVVGFWSAGFYWITFCLPLLHPFATAQALSMFNVSTLLNQKDSRWLQLEVCREYQRQKCTRSGNHNTINNLEQWPMDQFWVGQAYKPGMDSLWHSALDCECKFAHPPPNVEVQNGRVTACYDSIKVGLAAVWSASPATGVTITSLHSSSRFTVQSAVSCAVCSTDGAGHRLFWQY